MKITVSLIGEARTGFSTGDVAATGGRAGLIAPVVVRSPASAEARCSSVDCR
jgi:hypothetical protein